MVEEKYTCQKHNPIAKHQWQVMVYVFNKNANLQFTRSNSIFKIDNLKKKMESKAKKKKNPTGGTPLIWIWFHQCDRVWGQILQTQGIQDAIDVGNPEEDVEAVDVGGPSGLSSLNLNKLIEVDTYKTSSKNLRDKRLILNKYLYQS